MTTTAGTLVTPESKPILWTLDDGLLVVRLLQAHAGRFGYHLTLGGEVLNRGESRKELDLYFLPRCNALIPPNPEGLLGALSTLCGPLMPIRSSDTGEYPDDPLLFAKVTFSMYRVSGREKRIDICIYNPGTPRTS